MGYKRKERKFPIKEWEKAKRKERKFPIKEWEKEKREEGGKKAPDRGSKEKQKKYAERSLDRTISEQYRIVTK